MFVTHKNIGKRNEYFKISSKGYDILKREECIECTADEAASLIGCYGLEKMTIQTQDFDGDVFGEVPLGDNVIVCVYVYRGKILAQCFQWKSHEQHWFVNEKIYLSKMGEMYDD